MRASSAARRNGQAPPPVDGSAPPTAGAASFKEVGPPDPNAHNFDPNALSTAAAIAAQQAAAAQQQSSSSSSSGISGSHDWIAYALMVVGWFILIRALSDFYKARRHEKLVLASPERGLNVPIVAEGERAEQVA